MQGTHQLKCTFLSISVSFLHNLLLSLWSESQFRFCVTTSLRSSSINHIWPTQFHKSNTLIAQSENTFQSPRIACLLKSLSNLSVANLLRCRSWMWKWLLKPPTAISWGISGSRNTCWCQNPRLKVATSMSTDLSVRCSFSLTPRVVVSWEETSWKRIVRFLKKIRYCYLLVGDILKIFSETSLCRTEYRLWF